MLEDLQIRRYSPTTIRIYLRAIAEFAQHFGKAPDRLGTEHIRQYQLFLIKEKKVSRPTFIHLQQCNRCGHRVILYNSCRNRHCSKCQATARARWLAQRQTELLPVPYFHVVFTLPQQIGRLALQNAKPIYNILFRAASHLHCAVPGGGISLDGSRWIACPKSSFFLPVRVLSHRFRKKFLRQLGRALRKGTLRFSGELLPLAEPAAFRALCEKAAQID